MKKRKFWFAVSAVFLISCALSMPLYYGQLTDGGSPAVIAALLSIYNAMRIFALNGDLALIDGIGVLGTGLMAGTVNKVALAALYLIAPLFTIMFVLSFFRHLEAYLRYILSFTKAAYVFTELNERSIVTAESLSGDKTSLPVFCGVSDDFDNKLIDRAKKLGAVILKRDAIHMHFYAPRKGRGIKLFCMDTSEDKACSNALALYEKYSSRGNVSFYLFASSASSAAIAGSLKREKNDTRLRRIDTVLQAVYHTLYEHSIFDTAAPTTGDNKVISAVILGLGDYGSEMLRCLCWLGQMHGYRMEIHAFEKNADTISFFRSDYADLLAHSGDDTPGDAKYSVIIHNIEYGTEEFTAEISKMPFLTFVFAALGEDEADIDEIGRAHV
jgi:hypothetical protein